MLYKNVELYNIPYSENDRYVPLYRKLPESWLSIHATKNAVDSVYPDTPKDIFTRIKVPINFNDIINCNYLSATYIPTNGSESYVIYGWIDSIIPESDEKDTSTTSYNYNSSTIINFHVDYWRTYIEKITIKEGLILNRKPSDELAYFKDPPQEIPYIYEYSVEYEHPVPGQITGIAWVIFLYLENFEGEKIKQVKRLTFPVDINNPQNSLKFRSSLEIELPAPSLEDVINGTLITKLNLPSEKIQGCFISPISPIPVIEFKNNTFTLDWKKTAKIIETTNLEFIESIEGEEFNKKIYADHGNQFIVNDNQKEVLNIKLHNQDLVTLRWNLVNTGGLEPKADFVEHARGAINDFLNRNFYFNKEDFVIRSGPRGHLFVIYANTMDIEYVPVIEWLKRNFPNFYEWTQYDFSEAYLKNPEKDLWTRREERTEDFPHRTVYTKQNFLISGINVLSIRNNGYETYAHLSNGTTKRVYDYDIWIKNAYQKIVIYPKSSIGLEPFEITYEQGKTSRFGIAANTSFWPKIGEKFKPLASTNTTTLMLLDMAGQPIKRFNKKIRIDTITTEIITSSNTAAILLRFNEYHSALNQLETIIPCTPLEMGNSYYNEYITSGQRQSDLEHMTLSINQSLISAGINTALSALPLNPVAMGQAFVTGVNLLKESFFMGQNQEQHEKDITRKGNFLIRQSGDFSWVKNGTPVCLAMLKIDTYSSQNFNTTVREFGIAVNEFTKNIKLEEGPIRIQGAIITGNIPYQAREFIKNKLASGVYLDPNLSDPPNI